MDIFAGIKTFIFLLSSCVLYPTLILLSGLSVWIFFESGRVLAEWIRRKRLNGNGESTPCASYHIRLERFLEEDVTEAGVQNFLRKNIQVQNEKLDRFRIAVRIGPALGLIGTLVPMGTALASLGQGDLSVMTSELVVAYTTTVAGLLIGSVAYLIYTIRRRFVEADIREMEYLTERLFHEIHAQQP